MSVPDKLRSAAFIGLAGLGSALLCLWLAQALNDRLARDARQQQYLLIHQGQLSRLQEQFDQLVRLAQAHVANPTLAGLLREPLLVGQEQITGDTEPLDALFRSVADMPGVDDVRLVGPSPDSDDFLVHWSASGSGSVARITRDKHAELAGLLNAVRRGDGPDAVLVPRGLLTTALPVRPGSGPRTDRALGYLLIDLNLDALITQANLALAGQRGRPQLSLVAREIPGGSDIAAESMLVSEPLSLLGQSLTVQLFGQMPAKGAGLAPLTWRLLLGSALFSLILAALFNRWRTARQLAGQVNPVAIKTLRSVGGGDRAARARLAPGSDPNRVGAMLDQLLDKRQAELDQTMRENQSLHAAALRIAHVLGEASANRDLAVNVPPGDDATGAIAEAINQLIGQTGQSMARISRISQKMARLTMAIQSQSEKTAQLSRHERAQISQAALELEQTAGTLGAVNESLSQADDQVSQVYLKSQQANTSAGLTLAGIGRAREHIRQTEKRIKGLGERSQEIGVAVDNIASIAERTGILALNASLQAAAAGEAGRQFAALADEVKRLADSAGDATSQIASLVQSIKTETGHAVSAMNAAISDVVAVTEQAAQCANAMSAAEGAMQGLARDVNRIAERALRQGAVSQAVSQQVEEIREAGDAISAQMRDQAAYSKRLTTYARALIEELNGYKTPPLKKRSTKHTMRPADLTTEQAGSIGDAA